MTSSWTHPTTFMADMMWFDYIVLPTLNIFNLLPCTHNERPIYCAAYVRQGIGLALLQIMDCHLFRRQAFGTYFSKIFIKIQDFSFIKMHLKILFAKWQRFCPGEDEFKSDLLSPFVDVILSEISNHIGLCYHGYYVYLLTWININPSMDK